mgnify:CR=1 FL=1
MEFEGIVFKVLPETSGTSARGEWFRQDVVFEMQTQSPYTRKVCVKFFNKRDEVARLVVGAAYNVTFDIESREYNGRWFTSIRGWKLEKATNEVLADGWLFTGDMAQEDEDGFIFLVDRKKDVIISGGENLYPVQIEDFIREHKAVKDVAVIGLPDKRLGEIAAAVIEVKPDYTLTEEEVNDFCLDLPRYKRPRKIIFADVPRNPTGKIEKPRLREKYCGKSLVESQITN